MKPGRSQHPYGLLAPAARAALRFAARRNAPGRYGAWRPIALLWRRQRKRTDGVRAGRLAPATGAVWLPSFHLHFMTRLNDRPWRGSMPGSLPVAAIYQRRVVMDYGRTIVQSSMVAPLPRRDQRPVYVFSHRQALSGSGVKVQAAAPYASSVRRPVVPPTPTQLPERGQRPAYVVSRLGARSGSDTSIRAAVPYANPARQPVVPPTTTWITDHVQRLVRVFSRPNAYGDSGTSVQAAAPRANPARQLVVPPTTTLGTDRVQRLVRILSRPNDRGDSDANAQAAAPRADPARQPGPPIATWGTVRAQRPVRVFSLGQARSDSGTSVQVAAPYAGSARQRILPPTATWVADRAHYPNLGQPQPRVRPGSGADAQAQTLQTLRVSKHEPLVLRPRSTAKSNAAPPHSQESTAAQPYFHPQELTWRRAVPLAAGSAGNEPQADFRELGHPAHGRSHSEQGASPVAPNAFGSALSAPPLKIDSAMMDRLVDDVIRRVERRERIERARRGL
jgi:hypothetical protein